MPAIAGGSPEADSEPEPERRTPGANCRVIVAMGIIAAAATVFFGIYPDPLTDFAEAAGEALGNVR